MPSDLNLTPALKQKMAPYPRKRGRYNASELYAIKKGWTTPEKWVRPEERKPEDLLKMWKGILVHDHIQRLLPTGTNEIKREYNHNGITLVAKADNLPRESNEVWEIKTSSEPLEEAKPWHEYQAKLYTSIFERDLGIIYQPVSNKDGLFLKNIGEVSRDDAWFREQLKILWDFHLQVEKLFQETLESADEEIPF